jgi:uncharacterized membrane protein YvbJ
MKCPECGAENEERVKFCGKCRNTLPTPTAKSEVGKNRTIKGLKLGGVVLVGVLICGIIIVLVFGMWIILAIIFSAILGISLRSPICWAIGGIIPALILYMVLRQKSEGRINTLQ